MIKSIEEGRKEDGNRSIADKVIKRLHDIEKTVESNYGRWAWELLQNAKDSVAESSRSVSVQIEYLTDHVVFRHNGDCFTEKDIRGLINQISSKEVEEGEVTKKTGRFGTGFLTTHILSKVIHIEGIVNTEDNSFYKFRFPLDRDGKTTTVLVPKIEIAWNEFHKSTENNKLRNIDPNAFNTSFSYKLQNEKQKEIAKIGIEEFSKLIPYVLVSIPSIEKVEIINRVESKTSVFRNTDGFAGVHIKEIEKEVNGKKEIKSIFFSQNDIVSIAAPIKVVDELIDDKWYFESLEEIPKLFCDFPLIGTEKFHFPVIVNSFNFSPLTERDGVWLKETDNEDPEVITNKQILKEAVGVFQLAVQDVISLPFFHFFNIVNTRIPQTDEKYFDESWYKDEIQTPLRNFIFKADIIEKNGGGKTSFENSWFPSRAYSNVVIASLWQFTSDLFPDSVCTKDLLYKWCSVTWDACNKLSYQKLVADIAKIKTLDNLTEKLPFQKDAIDWLNDVGKFLLKDEANLSLFEKSAIIPNKNGDFKTRGELHIDKIKDETLIKVLRILGENWDNILLEKRIGFGKYQVKEKKDIAARITEFLKPPKVKESEAGISAIRLLTEWFEINEEEGKSLFSELFRRRAELFMNTIQDKENLYKVMRSKTGLADLSRIAEAIDGDPVALQRLINGDAFANLLTQYNISSVEDLQRILEGSHNGEQFEKREITKEDLVGMGVTSVEELLEVLKDKNLSALFHASQPSKEMFEYAQAIISRAKTNVIEYLQTLDNYNLDDMELLSNTVLGGITKDGLSIYVVVRPSDNGIVLVYYPSEKDSLDYANAELWIDNGQENPRQLTLGKILKTTGINRIPV